MQSQNAIAFSTRRHGANCRHSGAARISVLAVVAVFGWRRDESPLPANYGDSGFARMTAVIGIGVWGFGGAPSRFAGEAPTISYFYFFAVAKRSLIFSQLTTFHQAAR